MRGEDCRSPLGPQLGWLGGTRRKADCGVCAVSIAEFISQVGTFVFGSAIAGGLFFGVHWRNAYRWRMLARHYGREWRQPTETRTMQNGVLYGHDTAYNSYKGILKIGVDHNGVSLAIIRPFSFFYFCEPLYIPFKEIKGWQQSWYLDSKSVELEFARVPEIKMVMPADQVEWMRKRAGQQLTIRAEPTPHKDKPVFWYYFVLIQSAMIIGVVTWMLVDGHVSLF